GARGRGRRRGGAGGRPGGARRGGGGRGGARPPRGGGGGAGPPGEEGRGVRGGRPPGPALNQGYLRVASRVARVRLRPAPSVLGSSLVSRRRVWALPSKPPMPAASSLRAASPLCPNGL